MSEVLRPLLGLAPVMCFLAVLVALDSYKLVKLKGVLATVVAGGAMAGLSYFANGELLERLPIGFPAFTRYVSPFVEELLKAAIVVLLIRTHRIGFLVDAAIVGFAMGTGFGVVENLLYLRMVPDAVLGTWLVRGFGTAIMHGGATAIFAVMGLAMVERAAGRASIAAFVPGFLVAVALHSAFNHFFFSPLVSTAGIAILLPFVLQLVFARSEAAMGRWLGTGFDADTEMLELIGSGRLSDSPVGRYLHQLKEKFQGPVVADLICYLRLHTELALRAKGILMMRENGFDVPVDEATREKFAEMRYLEKSIGPTGRKALQPMLHMSHKDLWQLYMLGK
ncbi:MAG: PrsW family intramembrane metalloprotease [Burkholderiales bacterium]|nr:PrsW family intramembrane metalloprotease [Burkholderiales bacterium]